MIRDNMIKQINQLQFTTHSSLRTVQEAMVPAQFELGAERRHLYSYCGNQYPIRIPNRIILFCKNIPYRNLNKRKNHLTFIEPMLRLVKNRELYPFLLFINGKFIKWSNISIVRDFKYSYIIVDEYDTKVEIESVSGIFLPFTVAYNEQGIRYGSEYDIFTFNSEGRLDSTGKTVISYSGKNFLYKTDHSSNGFRNVHVTDVDPQYKMTDINVLVFREGEYYPEAKVKMDAFNIFTIDEGSYIPGKNSMIYKLFYYKRTNESNDMIYRFNDNTELIDIIKKTNYGIKPPGWFDLLNKPFDFKFSKDKDYEVNVEEGISYIMNYNPLLMNGMFKGYGNVVSRRFTGEEFLDLNVVNGAVLLPRTLDGRMFDNYVMVYVDGLLYKWHEEVRYYDKYVKIPIQGILPESMVEIVYFMNIDNRRYNVVLNKEDLGKPNVTDPTINKDKLQLFDTIPFDPKYDVEETKEAQYIVPFIWTNSESLRPSLSFYYGRELVMTFDNQFRYRAINITEPDMIYVELPSDFWYCKNEKSFMVFLNQTRLNDNEFRITIPKKTRPFDQVRLYTTIPLQPGDKLDVFYVGTNLEDIVIIPKIDISGDIIIDKSKIAYALSKDVYFVYVNGMKIPPEHIQDIDSTHIKITHNCHSIENVSIVKYIDDEDIIKAYLQSDQSAWDRVMSMIPPDVLNELFDTHNGISNDYERFPNRDMYTLKAIVLEVIKDFWLVRGYNTGDPFVYDFDSSVFDTKDGIAIITGIDATEEERIHKYDEDGNDITFE